MNLGMFVLGGVILVAVGILQALVRPRDARERSVTRYVNRATIRGAVFVVVGILAVLVGLGILPFVPPMP